MKLPVLYLVDSIVKNIGDAYTSLFTQNIVATFCSVFEKVFQKEQQNFYHWDTLLFSSGIRDYT